MSKEWKELFIEFIGEEHKAFAERGIVPGLPAHIVGTHRNEETFSFVLAVKLVAVSRSCRTREGHREVLGMAVRQMLSEHFEGFIAWAKRERGLVFWTDADTERLAGSLVEAMSEKGASLRARFQWHVGYVLSINAKELFGEQVIEVGDAVYCAHPMQLFVRYLNEYDRLKEALGEAYVQGERRRYAEVVALRRAGLAVLPQETWSPRVALVESPAPR